MTATAMTTRENNDLIGWMKKNNRAARAARTLVAFFDVVYQTTTWNLQIYGFNDNLNTQQYMFYGKFCGALTGSFLA